MTASSALKTIVIGGGVVGASIAYHLAKRGGAVTLLDPNDESQRATRGTMGWINAHAHEDRPFFELRVKSMRMWRTLIDEIPGLPARLGGGLNWDDPLEERAARLEAYVANGLSARMVSADEIRALEPAIGAPPAEATLAEDEGVVFPERIAGALADAAETHGAIRRADQARGVAVSAGRVIGVDLEDGRLEADAVVIAAGLATPTLLEPFGAPLPTKGAEGLIIRTQPVAPMTTRMMITPGVHFWQMDDGAFIAAEDFMGGDTAPPVDEVGPKLCARLNALFPAAPALNVASWTVRRRPDPQDGRPAIGPVAAVEGLYAAMLHSGVTFAPAVGAALAAALLDGRIDPDFGRYAINRFA